MTALPDTHLQELERLAHRLDRQFRIPGTSVRFGWDSLLGLVPGLGDVATIGPAAYLLYRGRAMGARKRTLARMAANSGVDLVIGAIPLVGDLFDVLFKANIRNIDLLKADIGAQHTATPKGAI